mmetsp:Transcript_28331/g.83379  ORF Transcript_28331/g.83379 Transcript_28331/m.83379 type:complete len:103 (-) Transcript_28331:753-1061(-)
MTPGDLATIFAETSELFEPTVGQTTDSDLHRLREALFPILLDVPYDTENGIHNLVGIITDDGDYSASYGSSFVRPKRIAIYDASIAADASAVVRAKAEAQWR